MSMHAFTSSLVLGIGNGSLNFAGMSMAGLLKSMFDMFLSHAPYECRKVDRTIKNKLFALAIKACTTITLRGEKT